MKAGMDRENKKRFSPRTGLRTREVGRSAGMLKCENLWRGEEGKAGADSARG